MKKILFICLLSFAFSTTNFAQYSIEETGYAGDHFSLEGAVDLFKQSYSVRNFERKLNSRESWVNNLDLDYDGRTDYVRVEHRRQGSFHAIVLQVPINRYDVQDIAVIEIEKIGRRRAVLQIIGDEDIYGNEVIVEAYEGDNYSYRGGNNYNNDYVNVYYWPAVQSIFDRNYSIYTSPYRWHYYPTWWSPWNRFSWHIYRPYRVRHRRFCRVVNIHRVVHVHNFYKPHRSYSHHVVNHSNKVRKRHGKPPIVRGNNNGNNGRGYTGSRRNGQRPRGEAPNRGGIKQEKTTTRSSNQRRAVRPDTDTRKDNPSAKRTTRKKDDIYRDGGRKNYSRDNVKSNKLPKRETYKSSEKSTRRATTPKSNRDFNNQSTSRKREADRPKSRVEKSNRGDFRRDKPKSPQSRTQKSKPQKKQTPKFRNYSQKKSSSKKASASPKRSKSTSNASSRSGQIKRSSKKASSSAKRSKSTSKTSSRSGQIKRSSQRSR